MPPSARRGVPEETAALFRHVERARLVVGHAALGLRTDRELAHLLGHRAATLGRDAPLAEQAVAAVVHEHVVAGRAGVHAQAVGVAEARRHRVAGARQLARRGIEEVERDALVGAVAGSHQRARLAVDHEAVAQVHVVHAPVGHRLQQAALEVIDVEAEVLVGGDDRALRGIARVHPDRRIVGRVAPGLDRRRLERRRHRARSGRRRLARVGKGSRGNPAGSARLAPADDLEVAVLAFVVLVGDDEDALGIGLAHRRRRERKSLGLADGVHGAAGADLEAPDQRPLGVVDRDAFRRGVGHDEERLAVRSLRERDALDLLGDPAARCGHVDDLAGRVRLDADRQRHDAERLVAVEQRPGGVVHDAELDALAERHGTHEPPLQRVTLREQLPLEHLAGIRHAERIGPAGDRALEAAEASQLVVHRHAVRPAGASRRPRHRW